MSFILALLFFTTAELPVDKSYLLGQYEPSSDIRFAPLTTADAKGNALRQYLRKETLAAFRQMQVAAEKENVHLIIVSATRNFDRQKKIWEAKWNGETPVEGKRLNAVSDIRERAGLILHYSAMPGTSRHHWGTDIDLNETEDSYFSTPQGASVYMWLTVHAVEFGFCQPYTSKQNGRTGYEEEKWHWSYVPLSKIFLDAYRQQITDADITGFAGSETAASLHILSDYVGGVACH